MCGISQNWVTSSVRQLCARQYERVLCVKVPTFLACGLLAAAGSSPERHGLAMSPLARTYHLLGTPQLQTCILHIYFWHLHEPLNQAGRDVHIARLVEVGQV